MVPARSGLLLHDGDLDLTTIGGLRPGGAELAYLSACSTSVGGISQLNESVTVAGAFQLAGFRHVIGTLWPMHDSVAVEAAAAFYGAMPVGGGGDGAAHALHAPVQALRSDHPDRPDIWAQLIHIGS